MSFLVSEIEYYMLNSVIFLKLTNKRQTPKNRDWSENRSLYTYIHIYIYIFPIACIPCRRVYWRESGAVRRTGLLGLAIDHQVWATPIHLQPAFQALQAGRASRSFPIAEAMLIEYMPKKGHHSGIGRAI